MTFRMQTIVWIGYNKSQFQTEKLELLSWSFNSACRCCWMSSLEAKWCFFSNCHSSLCCVCLHIFYSVLLSLHSQLLPRVFVIRFNSLHQCYQIYEPRVAQVLLPVRNFCVCYARHCRSFERLYSWCGAFICSFSDRLTSMVLTCNSVLAVCSMACICTMLPRVPHWVKYLVWKVAMTCLFNSQDGASFLRVLVAVITRRALCMSARSVITQVIDLVYMAFGIC